ncbi:hypothetical protein GCM10011583_70190 [Streptomyces camponoticapitis]|uniref:Uncharacterized protein n=1 Tax=Streptomyces camponoticapitis TaxID=1616125 RepID=A0ABQ2EZC3_9ACTN|nr:hypothetical protein GCM10011583_70190 [Streptomyces camponoticapitis]
MDRTDQRTPHRTHSHHGHPPADRIRLDQTINGHHINWPTPHGETGLRLHLAAAVGATIVRSSPIWTLWGGNTTEQPARTIEISRHTPAAVPQGLAYELALTHPVPTAHAPKATRNGHEALRTAARTAPPTAAGHPIRSR